MLCTAKICTFFLSSPRAQRKVKKLFPRWEMNSLSEGYKRAVDKKLGSYGKNPIFWPKTENSGPKNSLLGPKNVLTTIEKSCSKEKSCLFPKNISILRNFGCFWGKAHFLPKKHFPAKPKKGCFSIIPARTGSVILGHFFLWSGRFQQVLLKLVQN